MHSLPWDEPLVFSSTYSWTLTPLSQPMMVSRSPTVLSFNISNRQRVLRDRVVLGRIRLVAIAELAAGLGAVIRAAVFLH